MNTIHTLEDIFPFPGQTGIRERSFRLCALPFTYGDGVLKTSVSLGVNDVYFIRIS